MATNKTVVDTLYALCYDLPSENRAKMHAIAAKEKLEDADMVEFTRQRKLVWLRQHAYYSALKFCSPINKSVFLFSQKNFDNVVKLKDYLEGEYKMINAEPDIYILKYHQNSTTLLKERAVKQLTKRLNKLLDAIDEIEDKVRKQQKVNKNRVASKFDQTYKEIIEVSKSLEIDKDIDQILQIAHAKLEAF